MSLALAALVMVCSGFMERVHANLRVRTAVPGDTETIARFNESMARETERIELDSSVVRAGVQAVFGREDRGFYLLAEFRDQVVGQTLITREWSDWRNAWFWWVQSVYVQPEYRRCGVFRALFHETRRRAGESGSVCGLRLYVAETNALASTVYEDLGMAASHYRFHELGLANYRSKEG